MSRNLLPTDPKPIHYKLSITPELDTFLFTGHVDIRLIANEQQSSITLNYSALVFVRITLTLASDPSAVESIPVEAIILNEAEMKATFPLQKPFIGEAILSIDYTGTIGDNLTGFYRSKYTVGGKEAYMVTTQFESIDARRALPCWDEPAVKAVFEVSITAPSEMLALSNTPHYKKEAVDGKTRWFFEPTPKMSTYLLAWTVGVFECIEASIKKTHKVPDGEVDRTLVRVFTPEGKKSKASFALEVACQVLPLYEQFFGSNYVLPKVDLLAIPDFGAGAMENWGLITYREVALLCDANSSASQKESVAIVVAHELAHQWFGNLVTMEWWKELWLNESFATYMEYWAINKIFPEWHVFTQFVHSEITRAFQLDSLRSSHPVEVDVQNAKEIDDIFDAISYSKGGSILRMVVDFIGESAFRMGISEYLKHFAYSNATTKDLWTFLGKAAGKPLAPILENWTGKQGYPYLIVSLSPDRKNLILIQRRFLATGDVAAEEDQTVWKIPLLIETPESGVQRFIIEKREDTLPLEHLSWVKVNKDQSAFCRVLYEDEGLLNALLPLIASKTLSTIDRYGIISDYHAFARAGLCSAVDVLKLLSYFVDEDDFTVWCSIVDFEVELRMILFGQGRDVLSAFDSYCVKLYSKTINRIGMSPKSNEDHRVMQLRGVLFGRLTAAGYPAAVAYAKELYSNRQNVPVPPDLRQAVYRVYVEENGHSAFKEMKTLAETTDDVMERIHCLRALAFSRTENVVEDLFQYSLSDKIRSQDIVYVFSALASNPATAKKYADVLRQSWKKISEQLPGLILGRALKFLEYGTDATVADEMEAYWNLLDEKARMGMTRSFQQGVEGLRNNAVVAARNVKRLTEFVINSASNTNQGF
ncbi:Peptidase family M1 ERAP1 like C terminal domain [Trypanosoma vivax]|uniref:Aminopeptidase n=1 Tax=Trypanosoma vivax (strain Y486) TaxID=1055687 RepID=G0UAQ1_TRYVY|nr:putative aminopeptidase [Trypanosoma vivax]KAH8611321.1 Peptidase family M1 ERAP1 like C terminal domain [Trypanosoma vivax]CCC52886.1 putative aminopeptidase [Trypanosoma vivax Y486]